MSTSRPTLKTERTSPGIISRFILSPLLIILLFISLIGVPSAIAYSCYALRISRLPQHGPELFLKETDGALESMERISGTLTDTRQKLSDTRQKMEQTAKELEAQAKTLSNGE